MNAVGGQCADPIQKDLLFTLMNVWYEMEKDTGDCHVAERMSSEMSSNWLREVCAVSSYLE